MPQHDDGTVMLGQLEQRSPDDLGLFQRGDGLVGGRRRSGQLGGPALAVLAVVQGELGTPLPPTDLVPAKIQRDAP